MDREKRHKVEQAVLPVLAAVPLFFTFVVSAIPVALFTVLMLVLVAGIAIGRPVRVPAPLLASLGVFYLFFFPVDAIMISRGLVAPCSHLLFFIAIYQTIESEWRENDAQRLLVAFLIFVTAAATSTHWTILGYVALFGFFAFRELVRISWKSSVEEMETEVALAPRSRYAAALGMATVFLAVAMFPLLPRVRDPYVRGLPSLSATQSTGISDEIDFSDERFGSDNPEVVARVWPGTNGGAFLPVRLRAAVYDAYVEEKWVSQRRRLGFVTGSRAHQTWMLGEPEGLEGSMTVQQRRSHDQRVFLPVGTWKIDGLWDVHGTRFPGVVASEELRRRPIDYTVSVSENVVPYSREEAPDVVQYRITPEVRSLAREITAGAGGTLEASRAIERYLLTNFEYVADISAQGEPISVDRFLLEERRGHCEYFAAGMVVLLAAVDVPARIVGGFYGGEPNNFSGYFVIRKSDAHAWVEVWDGELWRTFDPTPPDLRPGAGAKSLLKQFSAMIDSVSYMWDRWILTYGASDQVSLTQELIEKGISMSAAVAGAIRAIRRPEVLVPAIALVTLLVLGLRWRRNRIRDPYSELLHLLEKLGIATKPSMTSREVGVEVQRADRELALLVRPVIQFHEERLFAGVAPEPTLEQRAKESLSRLRTDRGRWIAQLGSRPKRS